MSRVLVLHTEYGCESGCCGHTVNIGNKSKFKFDHPGATGPGPDYVTTPEDIKKFIIRIVTESFGAEHVKDIDFDNCIVLKD